MYSGSFGYVLRVEVSESLSMDSVSSSTVDKCYPMCEFARCCYSVNLLSSVILSYYSNFHATLSLFISCRLLLLV